MTMNYKVSTPRGPSLIAANPQRLTSVDGKRWACGRNVKRSLGNRCYDGVEVWTLRERGPDGLARTVDTHVDRIGAEEWVRG